MKVVWEAVFSILSMLQVVLLSPNEYQRIKDELKIAHPKLYKKARRELCAEELVERLPGVSYEEALEAMNLYSKHRGANRVMFTIFNIVVRLDVNFEMH